jgi:phosphonate transport system substrate-binding protein
MLTNISETRCERLAVYESSSKLWGDKMLKRQTIVKRISTPEWHNNRQLAGLNRMVAPIVMLVLLCTPLTLIAQPLSFAVVPQQSAHRLAKQWGPIMQSMSRAIGQEVIFTTAPDIPTFEQRLKKGEYSFAYMNPYHFTVYNQQPGYQALAHAKDKQIKGIIVIRKKSGIESVNQLEGRELAFPSPAAFAASILTRSYLSERGVDFAPKYVSSHDSVYLSVARGLYPAGGGVLRTFNAISPEIRAQLTAIWTTDGFTPHAIAVHPDIDPAVARRVQEYLVQMDSHDVDAQLLKPLKIKGFIAATNSEWDDVRALNIDLLSSK